MPQLPVDSSPRQERFEAIIKRIRAFPREVHHRYRRLSIRSKTALWSALLINIGLLVAVIVITPTRIGQGINDLASHLRGLGFGGVVLCMLFVVLASHPPLFGFMGSMTLIGFTYGIWPGFLIATISSLLGAAIAFLSVRAFFLSWVRKRSNAQWDAFGHVMANKGLPLVVMIRYCPLPWAMGNGLFASIESVRLWHFMVANLAIMPKLLIPVFIGSRLTSLSHDTSSHDPYRFWFNIGSILVSSTVSMITGIWIYRLTLEQIRKLGSNDQDGEMAAEALERGTLLGDYADEDEEVDDEPLTLRGESLRPTGGVLRRSSSSGEST